MSLSSRKFFANYDTDITCHYKTVSDQVDASTQMSKNPNSSSSNYSFHNHDDYEILLLLEGDLNFYTETSGKELKPGDLVCIRPYDFHRALLMSPNVYRRIVISISQSVMNHLSSPNTDLAACFSSIPSGQLLVLHLSDKDLDSFISCALQLSEYLSSSHYGDDVLAYAFLTQILVSVNRLAMTAQLPAFQGIMPDAVKNAFSYIEEHLTESFTLQELAEELHHNQTYLCRCFKKVTGLSMQQYVIIKKIALAQKFLRKGYSPQDVCYMSGFNNYSNFSRTFSKQTGMPPKQYQLEHS